MEKWLPCGPYTHSCMSLHFTDTGRKIFITIAPATQLEIEGPINRVLKETGTLDVSKLFVSELAGAVLTASAQGHQKA